MRAGDLVQIKRDVYGQGDVGVIIGPSRAPHCWDVLFHDGVRSCHPSNLQKPDGRTRRRP